MINPFSQLYRACQGQLWASSANHRVKMLLGAEPRLYRPYCHALYPPRLTSLLAGQECTMVVEGYPRSANTFAIASLALSNPQLSIASHHHMPAQIVAGVRLKKPVLILARNPVEAMASLLVRIPQMGPVRCAELYAFFYEVSRPYLSECVIGEFTQVTGNFNAIISRLNERYGLMLNPVPPNSEDAVRRQVEQLEMADAGAGDKIRATHVARPDARRADALAAAAVQIQSKVRISVLSKCQGLFEHYQSAAQA